MEEQQQQLTESIAQKQSSDLKDTLGQAFQSDAGSENPVRCRELAAALEAARSEDTLMKEYMPRMEELRGKILDGVIDAAIKVVASDKGDVVYPTLGK